MKPVAIRVTDEHQRPLAGVRVYPWLYQKPKKGGHANLPGDGDLLRETDAQGVAKFEVPADLENSVVFWARLKGYDAPKRCEYDPKAAPVELTAVLVRQPVELTTVLVRQVPLTGRVVDADGRPAAGAVVRVGGQGKEIDSFRGEVVAGADGTFAIDVTPDMYYLVVAGSGRLASAPRTQMIRLGAPPPAAFDLELRPATRVAGRLTGGPERQPIAEANVSIALQDDSYYRLPKEQRLTPDGTGRSVTPGVNHHVTTGADGSFETYVGPGEFTAWASSKAGSASQKFTVQPGQQEQALPLHVAELRTGRAPTFSGRVVLRDEPTRGVPDMAIRGQPADFELTFVEGASGADGAFTVRATKGDVYLHAASPDGKTQGIALAKRADFANGVTVPVGPTGSAAGRLVDEQGRPLGRQKLDYGYKVKSPTGLSTSLAHGSVQTSDDGRFRLEALVPGFEYGVDFVIAGADGEPKMWREVTRVTVDAAKSVELGDVKYVPPPVPKRWDEYAAEAFQRKDPLAERLEKARRAARFCYQRPLVVFGGPERPTAKLLGKLRYDHEDADEAASAALTEFVMLAVDVEVAGGGAKALAERLTVAWPVRETTLVVLGEDGEPLARVGGEELAKDGKPDAAKFATWARRHALPKPDAKRLLDDALAAAKADGRRVLVDQTSAYCGWCVRLGEYLEANQDVLSKDYVTVTLDRRLPGGQEILDRLRPKKEYSTPWMVILDADGNPLADSDGPEGNVGYPNDPAGLGHWGKMIRTTARHLTDADVERLLKPLRP
jgi:hypothetical protein